MNRAERRAREKEKKKDSNKKVEALAWFRSLPPAKQILIESLVKCECGNITYMTHRCLKSSVSCGCYQKENCSKVGLIYNAVGREAYKNKLNNGKVKL